jgi:hypothetical protein
MMFKDQAELLAFFSQGGAAQLASAAAHVAPVQNTDKVTAGKPAATPTAPATATTTPKASAKAGTAAASPSDPKPVAAATPAASTASSEKPADSVDYPTLQKAVFALANASREAAGEVAQSFNVKTFKELPAAQWLDALTAVNTKLAELQAA